MNTSSEGSIIFEKEFTSVEFFFIKHDWSGIIEVHLNGCYYATYDLYKKPDSGFPYESVFYIGDLLYKKHKIEIKILSEKNTDSVAHQVFLYSIKYGTNNKRVLKKKIGNEGAPFNEKTIKRISELSKDALILDAGGGYRQIDDERYINFEYTYSGGYPDIYGDGHFLPFKDNSFDFIISTGVLEHTYNPFQVSSELYRVLKPGGHIYVDTAFIQPYHGVPHHYFNFTLSGIKEVLKNFNEIELYSCGRICDILRWYFRDIKVEDKIGKTLHDEVLKEVEFIDSKISDEERNFFAGSVHFWGYK